MNENTGSEIELSIVIAIYNEASGLQELLERVGKSVTGIGISTEIIMVDDGSSDDSLAMLKAAVGTVPGLRVVELARNYGQVAALGAGMSACRGRWVLMMDGDLQHDPDYIPTLYAEAQKGHDMVATYRMRREDAWRRRAVTAVANAVNRWLIGLQISDFGSAFRLFSSDIVAMLTDRDGFVHYNTPALYAYARSYVEVPIVQKRRLHGESKWTLIKFISFNMDFLSMSQRIPQYLLLASVPLILFGLLLYGGHLVGMFPDAQAMTGSMSVVLLSGIIALLSILWRELLKLRMLVMGTPPYKIRQIHE